MLKCMSTRIAMVTKQPNQAEDQASVDMLAGRPTGATGQVDEHLEEWLGASDVQLLRMLTHLRGWHHDRGTHLSGELSCK